tara:strand:- start:9338 stop:10510 length:1173 start_codon:yes stop_codon:yes gene_type:complete
MRIGIVLSKYSEKSETFFRLKIDALNNTGKKVIVFSDKNHMTNNVHFVKNPILHKNRFMRIVRFCLDTITIMILKPAITYKFLRLEKLDQISFFNRWANLFLNSKILRYELDWLHFGFITLALRRENVARAIGAKMAVSLRGYDINTVPLRDKKIYKSLWNKIDKIHSISNYLLIKANSLFQNHQKPYSIIHPAIDLETFEYIGDINHFSKKRTTNFLTVARLNWIKGLESTIEAMGILNLKSIDFHYSIVGSGEDKERILFACDNLGILSRVTIYENINHNDVYTHYCNSDLYIQYSHEEGFCNSVLEAQATGIPCIVSNSSGLIENIINNKTGWVVQKNKPTSLAVKIEEILEMSQKEILSIKSNARHRIETKFNLDYQAKLFDRFYD